MSYELDDPRFAEINAEISASIKAQHESLMAAETAPTDITKGVKAAEAADTSTYDLAKMALNSMNQTQDVYKYADRALIPNDPNFDLKASAPELQKGLPSEYWDQFNGVGSLEEGQSLRDDILSEMKDKEVLANAGIRGQALGLLSGVLDPISFIPGFTGSKVAAGVRAVGMTGRTGKIIKGAAQGLEAGVTSGALSVAIGPTGTWRDIPAAGLAGLAFGAGLGTLGKTEAQHLQQVNDSASKLRSEFSKAADDGSAGHRDTTTPINADDTFTPRTDNIKPPEQPSVPEMSTVGDSFFNDEKLKAARTQPDASREKLIYMSPEDFLKMAEQRTAGIQQSKETVVEGVITRGEKFSDIPLLAFENIGDGTANVVSHEGRHRADALIKRGITKMPVILKSAEGGPGGSIRWGQHTGNIPKVLNSQTKGVASIAFPVSMEPTIKFQDGSVGAASLVDPGGPDLTNHPAVSKMRQQARTYLAENGVGMQAELAFPNTPLGRTAERFHAFLANTPLATDYDRLMGSNSMVAKALAYKTAESAAGITRNNTSGGILKKMYEPRVAKDVLLNIDKKFMEYAKGTSSDNEAMSDIVATFQSSEERRKFYRQVILEQQAKYFDGVNSEGVHPAVKDMGDHIDTASAEAIGVLHGLPGEAHVNGSEGLKPTKGWWKQAWHGEAVSRVRKAGVKDEQIIAGLKQGYKQAHPDWSPEWHEKMAKATLRRMDTQLQGIDMNLYNMLQEEGIVYMQRYLIDSGLDAKSADSLIAGLRDTSSETNKIQTLRHRTDIDLRQQIPGTEFQLVDLTDQDIVNVWSKYSRRVSGYAALARHGIQYADRHQLIDAMSLEDPTLSRQFLEGYFSYFSGEAVAGGINPWARRAMGLTNRSLLSSLGLTQAAETGVQISSLGVAEFTRLLKENAKAMHNGDLPKMLKDLEPYMQVINGEHHLMRPELQLDEMSKDSGFWTEFGSFADSMLAKGAKLQNIISGFQQLKHLQTNTAIHGMTAKLDGIFTKMAQSKASLAEDVKAGKITKEQARSSFEEKAGTFIDPRRLADIGISGKIRDKLLKYWENGTVNKAEDGSTNMNFENWDARDVQELAAALTRHSGQVIQESLIGEGTVWMNSTEGAFLMQLKRFAIGAMQKQTIRHMRIADPEAVGAFAWGLASAATVYMIRSAVNGKDIEGPGEVAKGAFQLSNLTGWVPMWTDPIAGMLGMDDLKFSKNFQQGVGGDVIGVPPTLTTLGRIAHIPEAAFSVATGNQKKDDIYALQATPIIGNAVGFGYIWNSMKRDIDEKKKSNTKTLVPTKREPVAPEQPAQPVSETQPSAVQKKPAKSKASTKSVEETMALKALDDYNKENNVNKKTAIKTVQEM